jgi:DNA-binding Lrp family transcriptional regulator
MSQRFSPYRHFVGSFIPNALMSYPDLSSTAKLMWARLAQYAGADGACFPSQKRLAGDLGISQRYVKTILKELVEKGFIEKVLPSFNDQIQGRTTRYYFLLHPVLAQVSHEGNKCSPHEVNKCSPPGGSNVPPQGGSNVPPEEKKEKKNEEGSFLPSPEEGKKKCQEIIARLCA